VADSAITTEREQSAMVQSVLRNVTAPTQAQLMALQAPESQHAFIHDEVPFEMWHFFGFTADAQMRQLGYSSRISRLSVRDNNREPQASPWDFTDVMVLESDLVDIESTARHATQQVERVALELAGTDKVTQKVWVGATTVEKLAVACATRYRLSLPRHDQSILTLDAAQLSCADSSILRSAVQRSASSMATSLTNTETNTNSEGRVWLVQAWGWPPDNSNAAVVFDRAWLVLDNDIEIQLQQTKRRSGKGPKTTTGTLWSIDTDTSDLLHEKLYLQWTTERNDKSVQWHISNANLGIDIVVEQVVETTLSPDNRWFGPVKISGSHQGFGFMDYQPI
jgi:predicted secreted hydrolase